MQSEIAGEELEITAEMKNGNCQCKTVKLKMMDSYGIFKRNSSRDTKWRTKARQHLNQLNNAVLIESLKRKIQKSN